jgi:hypothetical protein
VWLDDGPIMTGPMMSNRLRVVVIAHPRLPANRRPTQLVESHAGRSTA